MRKGVPDGVHLIQYYNRPSQYEGDSFEQYYSRASVRHVSDYERGVHLIPNSAKHDFPMFLVHGKRKRHLDNANSRKRNKIRR